MWFNNFTFCLQNEPFWLFNTAILEHYTVMSGFFFVYLCRILVGYHEIRRQTIEAITESELPNKLIVTQHKLQKYF